MNKTPLILIAEDDPAITTLLEYNLTKAGYRLLIAANGEEAFLLFREEKPDLIILDWMLPLISGIELLRRFRREASHVPILMVTAKNEEEDRIRGLDEGADDYLSKPFSVAELQARIKALLRRAAPELSQEILRFGDIEMSLKDHRVRREGKNLHLGPTEFRLLQHFLMHPTRVFSREQLLDAIWGQNIYVEIRTVDVHIRRLRKALTLNGESSDLIRTVRSAGYALDHS